MRRAVLAFALATLIAPTMAARAETVQVQSGEHPGFTRLVMDMARPSEVTFLRTNDGYALRFLRSGLRFDLSQVFRSIPRTRLATIWVDPQSDALHLGIACACHARLEQLGGDVLVIDVVDGSAPAGSPWELRSDGSAAPPLRQAQQARPKARPLAATPLPDLLAMGLPPPVLTTISTLSVDAGMRDALLSGFAAAAAAGLVDPADKSTIAPEGSVSDRRVETRLGDLPQVSVATAANPRPGLTATGEACISDDRLAIETWGGNQPFAVLAASHDAALIGEFDRTEPDGLAAAVRFNLHFGFGAEAVALLEAFPNSLPDAEIWREMAHLLDVNDGSGRSAAASLATQGACNGKAALWAALSVEHPGTLTGLDRAALRQAFSALPHHLRRLLGPRLVERLMNDGDMTTARSLVDMIDRAPPPDDAAQLLLSATLATREGDPAGGESLAKAVMADAGPDQARALIALVDAQLAQHRPVDAGLLDDLEAIAPEVGNGQLGDDLARVRALAVASDGNYDLAFSLTDPLAPSVRIELWSLLAAGGPDSALLTHALTPATAPVGLSAATRLRVAERLLALGFPEQSLAWVPGSDPAGLLAAARAELAAGDARAALSLIAGKTTGVADSIRAEAMMRLGDLRQAASTFQRLGSNQQATAALWQGQDWAGWLQQSQSPEKLQVSQLLEPAPAFNAVEPAPLAQGRALVADADGAARAVGEILAAMPSP